MSSYDSTHNTHCFVLRIWREELGNGQSEWRAQLESVRGGERRYFRDWHKLVAALCEMLSESEGGSDR